MLHVIIEASSGCNVKFHRSPIWDNMTQLYEWKFTRQLTELISRKLAKEKIKIHQLVTDKYNLYTVLKVNKVNRLAAKYGPENCLLISIQVNFGKGSGWSIYINEKNPGGLLYANIYDKNFSELTKRTLKYKNNGLIERDLTLLKRTKCPAIVTNNFYINRKAECKRMLTLEGIRALRDYHVEVIKECILYHKNNKIEIEKTLNINEQDG